MMGFSAYCNLFMRFAMRLRRNLLLFWIEVLHLLFAIGADRCYFTLRA